VSDTFGIKIGIEGEKEFKNALADINQSFKILGSEMQLVTSQFDKNDKSAQSLAARNTVLNKEIETQKDKITTLRSALENASDSFGENDRRTQNWQIQLNKAQAELNGMERELKDNEKALDSMGGALDDTGKDLNETEKDTKDLGTEMESTGKKSSTFKDMLLANLAADAIKAGLTAIVDLVKSVGTAIKEYVSDSMGMATEATQAQTLLTQVMRNTMGASDDQVSSLLELAAAQEKVGVVSRTAQTTALAELASFVERKQSLEDMLPVMNDYIAYQYGATASSEQARNVATALGKAINGSIDGLAKQGFTLTQTEREWFKTANEMERVEFITNMVSESMAGVNEALAQTDAGKMANLNTVLDNTKISVGTLANEMKAQIMGSMLPSISNLSDAFVGLLHGDGSVEELSAAFDDVFTDIAKTIEEFLPTVLEMGGKLITAVVTGIANNIDTIVDSASSIIDSILSTLSVNLPAIVGAAGKLLLGIVRGIIDNLPELAKAAMEIIATLAKDLGNELPELIPAIVDMLISIVEGIIDNLDLLLEGALALVVGLADGVIQSIPKIIERLPELIASIVDFIVKNVDTVIDAGVTLLTSLVENLPVIISEVIKAVPKIVDGLVKVFTDTESMGKIIDAGVKLLISLVENLPVIIWEILKAIPTIIFSITDALADNWHIIKDAGVQLLIQLFTKLDAVGDAMRNAVENIVNGIKNEFAKAWDRMREVGSDLIRGLWQGISDVSGWIWNQISGFMSGIVNNIKNFFGISSPSKVFAGIGTSMAEGLGVGFVDEMKQVENDIKNSIPKDLELDAVIQGSFNPARVTGAATEAMGSITNNFNISELIVREEADIDRIAGALFRKQQQSMRGVGVAYA